MTTNGSLPNLSSTTQKRILAVLIVTQFTVWIDTTVLNVALKTLADPVVGLGASPSELEWSISSYTLILAALLFTGGLLADRYGRRAILAIGLLIFGAASVWAAYSSTPEELIVARGFMGLGCALTVPATLTIIHNVFDDRSRAMAIAAWSGTSGLAVAMARWSAACSSRTSGGARCS
jgi:MFS family permease